MFDEDTTEQVIEILIKIFAKCIILKTKEGSSCFVSSRCRLFLAVGKIRIFYSARVFTKWLSWKLDGPSMMVLYNFKNLSYLGYLDWKGLTDSHIEGSVLYKVTFYD